MENSVIQSADQLMAIVGLVIFAGLTFTKISDLLKLPDVVLYILAGVLLGPNLLNLINMETFPVENQLILSFGAAYILYDGGREVDLKILNQVKISVGMLATIGLAISTTIVGFVAGLQALSLIYQYFMLYYWALLLLLQTHLFWFRYLKK